MATAERPPAKVNGKPNPEYQKWYRQQKKAEKGMCAPQAAARKKVKAMPPAERATALAVAIESMGGEVILASQRGGKTQEVKSVMANFTRQPTTHTVRGLKTLPNPAWVLATHPLQPGNVIEVEVRRGTAKQFVNKDFTVTLTADGTAKHESAV